MRGKGARSAVSQRKEVKGGRRNRQESKGAGQRGLWKRDGGGGE